MMCLDSAFAKTAIVDFRELKKNAYLLRGSANSEAIFCFKRSVTIEIGLEFSTNLF